MPAQRDPPGDPPPGQPRGGRERRAVEPGDRAQQRVLHRPGHGSVELPEPGALPVPGGPDGHRRLQVVQLHAAVVVAGPQVRQRPAELGVPHQRGQVVQRDGHPDVVDRRVGGQPDRPVGG